MKKIVKRSITMLMVCAIATSMSSPVPVQAHTHSYINYGQAFKSWIQDHMNGACSISAVYWRVYKECDCGDVVEISLTRTGDHHSLAH